MRQKACDNDHLGGFVLAAGEGRRLRPATLHTPKAAMPFCGIPLVELALRNLDSLGIGQVVVNTSHLGEKVRQAAIAGEPHLACRLFFSEEESLLNTGGGLRQGLRLVPSCRTILVHNADVVSNFPLRDVLAAHLGGGALATILLVPGQGPRTVRVDRNNRIVAFREPQGTAPYTFSGIYVFDRELLEFLPGTPSPSIVEAMERALKAGRLITGLPAGPEHYWSDLGTVRDYLAAHREVYSADWRQQPWMGEILARQREKIGRLRDSGVSVSGAVGLGDDLAVAAGTRLHDCVLWNHVRIPQAMPIGFGILDGGSQAVRKTAPDQQPDRRIYETLGWRPENVRLDPLMEQGSGRIYRRLRSPQHHDSYIWMAYNHGREENADFAVAAEFLLHCAVQAPRMVMHLPDAGQMLIEDLGDVQLRGMKQDAGARKILADAAGQAARLHVVGTAELARYPTPLQPAFDAALYAWERAYFREHLLTGLYASADLWTAGIEAECQAGEARLRQTPQVLLHRDLQSANVMVRDGRAFLIDFQGMRLGAAAYDVASLLYDPYCCWPGEVRDAIWAHYCREVRNLGGDPPTSALLAAGAVQRLLQALGAYGKLSIKDGREWYAQFVGPGLTMLAEATRERAEFAELNALAIRLLASAPATSPPRH